MSSKNHPPKATFESYWASLQETKQVMEKQFAENEQRRKESEQQWQEFRDSMKAMQKELGGVGNSNGKVAETYFANSFSKSMEFAGQKYDGIDFGLKRKIKSLNLKGEYDLLLYNCTSVVIIEIKYSAEKKHIGWLLKEVAVFKQLFPQYENFDLFLGLAALHFEEGTEKEAIRTGIAIIKQVGENMVIYDEHLKLF